MWKTSQKSCFSGVHLHHWIVTYRLDKVIRSLNNRGQDIRPIFASRKRPCAWLIQYDTIQRRKKNKVMESKAKQSKSKQSKVKRSESGEANQSQANYNGVLMQQDPMKTNKFDPVYSGITRIEKTRIKFPCYVAPCFPVFVTFLHEQSIVDFFFLSYHFVRLVHSFESFYFCSKNFKSSKLAHKR